MHGIAMQNLSYKDNITAKQSMQPTTAKGIQTLQARLGNMDCFVVGLYE